MPTPTIYVYPLPAFLPDNVFSHSGSIAVVMDLLRATTTMTTALAHGAESVETFAEPHEALYRKASLIAEGVPAENILLGGERGGVRIDGFDRGNSPSEYHEMNGRRLLFSTTNGTQAIAACQEAETILLASFLNAAAVVTRLLPYDAIHLVCAGTGGKMTEEDLLVAGCLVERLDRLSDRRYAMNVQAQTVADEWSRSLSLPRLLGLEPVPAETLAQKLRTSRGGKNLMALHLGRDILDAAMLDALDVVPERHEGNTFRIVPSL